MVFLFVAALATLGWFGLQQLERGTEYVVLEQGEQLPEPDPEPVEVVTTEPVTTEPEPTTTEPVTELSAAVKTLIGELEKLATDKVIMREGSAGTRVGTVQRFLNEYLDRSDKIDNAYGPGTAARIRDFQKAEGLTADGEAGPNTYRAMIKVLERG